MYWTPAKMLLLADVGEYSFANAGTGKIMHWTGKNDIEILYFSCLNIIKMDVQMCAMKSLL